MRSPLREYDPRRLKRVLLLMMFALAVPTAAVIWQAYGQLKFEAFYQYRIQAESLAQRVDANLAAGIRQAEARGFADFSFLNITGDENANVLQRSPLSDYPVVADVPGVIGYFQVGEDGAFSTPLLPAGDLPPAQLGLSDAELRARTDLADSIRGILADNRLVDERADTSGARSGAGTASDPLERGDIATGGVTANASEPRRELADGFDERLDERFDEIIVGQTVSEAESEAAPGDGMASLSTTALSSDDVAEPAPAEGRTDLAYGQRAFESIDERRQAGSQSLAAPKLRDVLELDDELQKKSEELTDRKDDDAETARSNYAVARNRRIELDQLPATVGPDDDAADTPASNELRARIRVFESEIDPYQFSRLDSGHLVLFRKVWRDGVQYVQGLLLEQEAFLEAAVIGAYRETPLSGMSDLVVGYRDDVVRIVRGARYDRYPVGTGSLQGTLLHRSQLSAPFDALELVFSINRLPPGPGAGVLAWTTLVIAVVFVAGFLALYRLGASQIRLARQQQDFVSAVSHELKTPLTSIRMYGEMLKEGWADEQKRKQYYEYIHEESERLTRLISNVLQLAKITRNEPSFDLHEKTVAELLDQTRSKIASHVERAGFELRFDAPETVRQRIVRVDDDCFAQIVINLVDNAIKFSKDADPRVVEFRAAESAGSIVFSVRDFGPGVPKDQMEKIFRLFYRSESELTRETVGTGIGLAIVHQLTVAMGGKVDVVNRDPGAEFRISIPAV